MVDEFNYTLTIREASDMLHIHINTLRRWSDKGIIRAYRLGPRRDRRFKRSDIMHLLTKLKENGGKPQKVDIA